MRHALPLESGDPDRFPPSTDSSARRARHFRLILPFPQRVMTEPSPLSDVTPFDYEPRTRVVFGPGTLSRLGDLSREIGGQRALLVTDAGLRKAGHQERAAALLRAADFDVAIYDEVHPNPTTDDIDRGTAFAQRTRPDLLVGLGGGSSMDAAKGINFLLTNGGKLQDYRGLNKATKPMLPLIAIPTTAGTGSEAQSYAVIADSQTHMKMACGDRKAAARIAILDAELALTMPLTVAAATGIDAISHALESYVTTARTPISSLFARRAWKLLFRAFPTALREPGNVEARGAMLLGAHLAGMAIENSMLGATHALVNPISAHFDTVHGVAIGVMLPHVLEYNALSVDRLYADLAQELGAANGTVSPGRRLAEAARRLVAEAGSPGTLAACGVTPETFAAMAREAAEQWTARFNPRPVDAAALESLYAAALGAA